MSDGIRIVSDVIDRVYNDGGVRTPLDMKASREIIAALRDAGWVDMNTLVTILDAAGVSRVEIPLQSLLADNSNRRIILYERSGVYEMMVLEIEPKTTKVEKL